MDKRDEKPIVPPLSPEQKEQARRDIEREQGDKPGATPNPDEDEPGGEGATPNPE